MKRRSTARQTTLPLSAAQSERSARDVETRRLQRLAKRVQKIVTLVNIAAVYHDDGAFDTARTRLRTALAELANASEYLAYEKWHDKEWRKHIAERSAQMIDSEFAPDASAIAGAAAE